jgi:hypothetical protein
LYTATHLREAPQALRQIRSHFTGTDQGHQRVSKHINAPRHRLGQGGTLFDLKPKVGQQPLLACSSRPLSQDLQGLANRQSSGDQFGKILCPLNPIQGTQACAIARARRSRPWRIHQSTLSIDGP